MVWRKPSKNIWKNILKKHLPVIKIGLYRCRVSHFSLCLICKLHRNVTLHNDFLGNQEYHWGCRTKSFQTVHVCMYPTISLNQQTLEPFNGIISKIYFLISHYAVWRTRWNYLHIKQIQISQDWNEIRESCKDQSV